MAYDQDLADRIQRILPRQTGFTSKKMFGGIGFLLYGNMCCGVWKDSLIARVGPDYYEEALGQPDVREFDITGRSMKGWVLVESDGIETDAALASWIAKATQFVRTLPAKGKEEG